MIPSDYADRGQKLLLEVRDIKKSYSRNRDLPGARYNVLNGLNLKIMEGEFVTIVGPSGCGKSTLLSIIAQLDHPDSGTVRTREVKQERGRSTPADRIVIFQESALFPWLTVLENIEFGLKIARIDKVLRQNLALSYAKMVGMHDFVHSYVYQLSGGMKQRVAIARALAMDPEILLMDEPFAALDVQTKESLYQQLLKIHTDTRKTILFVTHSLNEALLLANRIIVLSSTLANIKKEFVIDLPRPRDPDSPEMNKFKSMILKELEEDFRIARGSSSAAG